MPEQALETDRITRSQYGVSLLLFLLAAFVSSLIGPFGPVLLILSFCFLLFQGTKRSHDLGDDGWFQAALPIYIFWLLFAKGEQTKNKYGYPREYGEVMSLPSLKADIVSSTGLSHSVSLICERFNKTNIRTFAFNVDNRPVELCISEDNNMFLVTMNVAGSEMINHFIYKKVNFSEYCNIGGLCMQIYDNSEIRAILVNNIFHVVSIAFLHERLRHNLYFPESGKLVSGWNPWVGLELINDHPDAEMGEQADPDEPAF